MTTVDHTSSRELRDVFGMFATGITLVTATGDTPRGMTANAFTSVSIDPPLILICVSRSATMHRVIQDCGAFAVCVLGAGQEQVARHFADRGRPRGEREFDIVEWVPGRHTGVPVVIGSLAWLECRLTEVYAGGDHSIFLGQVLDSGRDPDGDALLFYGGVFQRIKPA
ncbi:flavin reductase family protein [Nocardia terpenica]|uniref:Flavin reductase n=1 Tax=Nocardia terpenica TaxID=455432 RepID=A0A161XI05_9NOCA|nr:flavin reductase family protein [Nocardia terpenica]KZM73248.1 flavin reductase [Nocardia terpenica]MBF6064144.1 flavin reductase family protein [Nocardia terpenica]MBF6106477.1 flavin reductase family protein [Nocardia terpenica]MBF6113762.1 flavin reductase family protein [Nocardia terpenica]MBF6120614.1 flavin reductase family protein [Nocardia terpenica]